MTAPKTTATTASGCVRRHRSGNTNATASTSATGRHATSVRRMPSSTAVSTRTATSAQSRQTRTGGAAARGLVSQRPDHAVDHDPSVGNARRCTSAERTRRSPFHRPGHRRPLRPMCTPRRVATLTDMAVALTPTIWRTTDDVAVFVPSWPPVCPPPVGRDRLVAGPGRRRRGRFEHLRSTSEGLPARCPVSTLSRRAS